MNTQISRTDFTIRTEKKAPSKGFFFFLLFFRGEGLFKERMYLPQIKENLAYSRIFFLQLNTKFF